MQIHVVQPGHSLYGIAQAYNVSLEELIKANELGVESGLVVGQTLVIPTRGSYHWVQPGDSLYKISQLYNISIQELAKINRIWNINQLSVGTRLYIPPKKRQPIDVNGYIEPRNNPEQEAAEVDKVGEHLSYLAVFSHKVKRDGSIEAPKNEGQLITAAYNDKVAPLFVLTNLEEDQFSTELGQTILSNESLQDKVLNEAIQLMEQKGYLGLNIDFEHLRREDRIPYNEFLRKALRKVREKGYSLSTALAPKVSGEQAGAWYEAHDYPAHGNIVDFVILMTYEWGWSGGPPMAVAPLDQVRRVVEYAASVMPNNKIMMGMPLYGYDWTLPYVAGGKFAKVVSPVKAVSLARQYNAAIQYDWQAQSPYFNYWDEQGKQHEVWFEDARSIQAKFNFVKELGLRGVSYWKLGVDFPQNWLLIEENFIVRKRV
jgi:spore germination protein